MITINIIRQPNDNNIIDHGVQSSDLALFLSFLLPSLAIVGGLSLLVVDSGGLSLLVVDSGGLSPSVVDSGGLSPLVVDF
jgi:hypothetical protein